MSQTITVKIKLLPTKEQTSILNAMGKEYISAINTLISEMVVEKKTTKKTTKDVPANLPSAVKNQAIKDAKKYILYKSKEKQIHDYSCSQKSCLRMEQSKLFV